MYGSIHTERAKTNYTQRSEKAEQLVEVRIRGLWGRHRACRGAREGARGNKWVRREIGGKIKTGSAGPGRFRARKSLEGRGGREGHGEARRNMTVALAMTWPMLTEIWRNQCWATMPPHGLFRAHVRSLSHCLDHYYVTKGDP